MKIIFVYSDHPNLVELSKDDIYSTSLEIPNEVNYLIGCRERVLEIGKLTGQLTNGSLHLTCKELELNLYPIRLMETDDLHQIQHNTHATVLYFERFNGHITHKRQLKIWSPIDPVVPQGYWVRRGKNKRERNSLVKNLLQLETYWCKTDEEQTYALGLEQLIQHILVLLNAEPAANPSFSWQCRGFHPWWHDEILVDRHNERIKRYVAQEQKRKKLEARQKERDDKLQAAGSENLQVPQTGAGRRPGARPGIFKGVQMRSQLEIRFAAELEERRIRWVYEGAVLGQGGYLVDFYLPDLGCWVEVKGRFEPRDTILLKEVSADLKRDRQERIFVYGQSRAWIVNPSGFREIKHDQFWDLINKI